MNGNIFENDGAKKLFQKLERYLSYEARLSFKTKVFKLHQEKQVSEEELPTFKVTTADIEHIFDTYFYALP